MTFNQFFKFATPFHKKQILSLKEGQLKFAIHDIQSIFQFSTKTKFDFELELERGSTIYDI